MKPFCINDFKKTTLSREFKEWYSWQSPSNIALVKYWGKKKGVQVPANASISMTLDKCHTKTSLKVSEGEGRVTFYYEGNLKESFLPKIHEFLKKIEPEFPQIWQFDYEIHSENTFPHSTGIASSASGMSALSLCFLEFACSLHHIDLSQEEFLKAASHWARLGSGSACRSVYGDFALWGENNTQEGSNDFAIPLNVSSFWKEFSDTILIVSQKEKQVSSRAGHSLMDNHPFAQSRYEVADQNINKTLSCLRNESWDELGKIIEQEAFMLHALMMTGNEPFVLIEPETLLLIKEVQKFRQESSVPVYFTLDAGPNLHLLYPSSYDKEVHDWVESMHSQKKYFQSYIHDRLGSGAKKIERK